MTKDPGGAKQVNKATETLNDLMTYQEVMLRKDAAYWKRACAEKLEKFVR